VRINITACLVVAQRAFPLLKAAGQSSLINISSISGVSGVGRGSLAYGMSKAALSQMTRELAVEWGCYGIRVNSILPSQFLTPALRAYLAGPQGEGKLEQWTNASPLHRLGEEEDIIGPALFLASNASSMVTGHQLAVDGGNLAVNVGATIRHDP
jgi:tropinone reductase I